MSDMGVLQGLDRPGFLRSMLHSKGGNTFLALLFTGTLFAAIGNLLVPPTSALYVDTYTITLLGKYLSFALLAMAVDVV
ncbi:MAG: urea ABC transporter permease subunit UrtC, partial [Gammaproteobacteria bacterium]|nr:urea ABC transporter permease subunit UrtC [Gammaproteobacteria bacterium]